MRTVSTSTLQNIPLAAAQRSLHCSPHSARHIALIAVLLLLAHLSQPPPHRLLRLGRRDSTAHDGADERHEPAKPQHPGYAGAFVELGVWGRRNEAVGRCVAINEFENYARYDRDLVSGACLR